MGFSLGKVFKPIKKVGQKLWRINSEGIATGARVLGGYFGAPELGNRIGDAVEPGDTASRNYQKRADFEYARSLSDQYAFQNDSVQRRVADARAAGIHPLAALGYQAPSFVPPQSSSGYYGEGDDNWASEMGQNIGRAVYATQTQKEREAAAATQQSMDGLLMQRYGLENENLRADLEYKRLRYLQLLRPKSPAFPNVNSNSKGSQSSVGSLLPDYMAIQQVGAAELNPTDNWHVVTDRSGYNYYAPPPGEDNELAQAEAFFRNKILYHAAGPFRRAGQMIDDMGNYYGGYKAKSYPAYPSRISRRVRGSRPNPAYYKDGWYN